MLTEYEAQELIRKAKEEYGLELSLEKYFRKAQGEHGLYYAMKMIKGQCIFLNKEKRCRIYRCRPKLCELYPVIDVGIADERCPDFRKNKFSRDLMDSLKKRYEDEIDEGIKTEQTFIFI